MRVFSSFSTPGTTVTLPYRFMGSKVIIEKLLKHGSVLKIAINSWLSVFPE
jgi:hypothetical protein